MQDMLLNKETILQTANQPTAHLPQIQAYESAITILKSGEMPNIEIVPFGDCNDIVFNGRPLAVWDDTTINQTELLLILEAYQETYLDRHNALDLANATPGQSIRAPIIGKVIDMSADYIVQDIGKGKRVYHAYDDLDLTLMQGKCNHVCQGDRLEIKYADNGKAKVINLNEKSREQRANSRTL